MEGSRDGGSAERATSTMSIRDKIRAMRNTLEAEEAATDSKLTSTEGAGNSPPAQSTTSNNNNRPRYSASAEIGTERGTTTESPSAGPSSKPRRASVVDMWRKRESEIAEKERRPTPINKPKKVLRDSIVNTSAAKAEPEVVSSPYGMKKDRTYSFEEKKEPARDEDPAWNQASQSSNTDSMPNGASHWGASKIEPQSEPQAPSLTTPQGNERPSTHADSSRNEKSGTQKNIWKQRSRSDISSPVVDTRALEVTAQRPSKDWPPLPTPSPSAAKAQPTNFSDSQPPENPLRSSEGASDKATTAGTTPSAGSSNKSPAEKKSRSKVRNMWLQRDSSTREAEEAPVPKVAGSKESNAAVDDNSPKKPQPSYSVPVILPQKQPSFSGPVILPSKTRPRTPTGPPGSSPSPSHKEQQGSAHSVVVASPLSASSTPRMNTGIPPGPSPSQKRSSNNWIPSSPSSAALTPKVVESNVGAPASPAASYSAPHTPRGSVLNRWNNRSQSSQLSASSPTYSDAAKSTITNSPPVSNNEPVKSGHSPATATRDPGSPQFNAVRAKWAKFGAEKGHSRDSKLSDATIESSVAHSGTDTEDGKHHQQEMERRSKAGLAIPEKLGEVPNTATRATVQANANAHSPTNLAGKHDKQETERRSKAGLVIPEKLGEVPNTTTNAAGQANAKATPVKAPYAILHSTSGYAKKKPSHNDRVDAKNSSSSVSPRNGKQESDKNEAGLPSHEKHRKSTASPTNQPNMSSSTSKDGGSASEPQKDKPNSTAKQTPLRRQMLLRRHRRPGRIPDVESTPSTTSTDSIDLAPSTDAGTKQGEDLETIPSGESQLEQSSVDATAVSDGGDPTFQKKKNRVGMGRKHAARPKAAGEGLGRSDEAGIASEAYRQPAPPKKHVSTYSNEEHRAAPRKIQNKYSAPAANAEDRRIDTRPVTSNPRRDTVREKETTSRKDAVAASPHIRNLEKKKFMTRLAKRASANYRANPVPSDDYSVASDTLSQAFDDAVADDEQRKLSARLTVSQNASYRKNEQQLVAQSIPMQTLLACGAEQDEAFGTPFYAGHSISGKSDTTASEYASSRVSNSKKTVHKAKRAHPINQRKPNSSERSVNSDIFSDDGCDDITSQASNDWTVDTGYSSQGTHRSALASRAGRHLRDRRIKKSVGNIDRVNRGETFEKSTLQRSPSHGNERHVVEDKNAFQCIQEFPATEKFADRQNFRDMQDFPQIQDFRDNRQEFPDIQEYPDPQGFHDVQDFPAPMKEPLEPLQLKAEPSGSLRTDSRESPMYSEVPAGSSPLPSYDGVMSNDEKYTAEPTTKPVSYTDLDTVTPAPRKVVTPEKPRQSPTFSSVAPATATKSDSATVVSRDSSMQSTRSRPRTPRKNKSIADNEPEKMVTEEFVAESGSNVEAFRSAYQTLSLEQIANDLKDEAESVLNVKGLSFQKFASDFNDGVTAASQSLNQLMGTDVFPKVNRIDRGPSPVEEEIAIEVEYIED